MSAAASAAGYLYSSGRLHRTGKEQEQTQQQQQQQESPVQRERIRVAVYPREERKKPSLAPKIEYRRRRRWSPE